jgi:phosphoribosyl-AMP cyclohydrolase
MVEIDFKKGEGLVPVIVQDDATGDVLMLAYMNSESWLKTLETGKATYWSRSRNELWIKGETSGHVQIVKEIFIDCDNDTILLKVEQIGGAACHTGYKSCFYRKVVDGKTEIVGEIVFKPEDVYK